MFWCYFHGPWHALKKLLFLQPRKSSLESNEQNISPLFLACFAELSKHSYFSNEKKSYKCWLAESVFVLPLFSQICCAVSKYNPFQNALNIMHIIQLLAYKTNMNYCILQKVLSTLQPSLISLVVLNSHDSSQNFTSTSYSFIKTHLFRVSTYKQLNTDRVKAWYPNNELLPLISFCHHLQVVIPHLFDPKWNCQETKNASQTAGGKQHRELHHVFWHLHYSSGRTFLASMRSRFICKGNAHCNHIVTKLILILYGCNNIKD